MLQNINIEEALKKHFGFDRFRFAQEKIIRSVLTGKNALAVMPTGGGKSLCYQLPAVLTPGTAVVISPLISLMKDQIDALVARNISATFINSALPYPEISNRMQNAIDGRYKLIYIAPERLDSSLFRNIFDDIDVSFLAIDEAHCISEWGHDFRPAYLKIRRILQMKPRMPVVALTATATPEVRSDILRQLGLSDAELFLSGFDRPNLRFITEFSPKKHERLLEICAKSEGESIIIYCGSRRRTEGFSAHLTGGELDCAYYHAGLAPAQRKRVQDNFIKGKTKIIVATSAFGMGIDKPDVRKVIHMDYTMTLEQYYQEAGRAGRDGKPSECIMLYDPKDIRLQEYFIRMNHPGRSDVHKVFEALKAYFRGPVKTNSFRMDGIIADMAEVPRGIYSSAMRLLEKHGVIGRTNSKSEARICFTSDQSRVREYFENIDDYRRRVLEALLRSLSRRAFGTWIAFDPAKVVREHSLDSAEFDRAVKAFRFAGIIDYKAPARPGSVRLRADEPFEKLDIDWETHYARRDFAERKLDIAAEYATTPRCKRNYILEYFGAEKNDGGCGNCSSCG
jgi:ATP-dependent DNA helicase RecQ